MYTWILDVKSFLETNNSSWFINNSNLLLLNWTFWKLDHYYLKFSIFLVWLGDYSSGCLPCAGLCHPNITPKLKYLVRNDPMSQYIIWFGDSVFRAVTKRKWDHCGSWPNGVNGLYKQGKCRHTYREERQERETK